MPIPGSPAISTVVAAASCSSRCAAVAATPRTTSSVRRCCSWPWPTPRSSGWYRTRPAPLGSPRCSMSTGSIGSASAVRWPPDPFGRVDPPRRFTGSVGAAKVPLKGFIKKYVDELLRVAEKTAARNADEMVARGGRQIARQTEFRFRPGKRLQKRLAKDPKLREEYVRQVRLQERGINSMSVEEFLKNRKNFSDLGRGSGEAQRAARERLIGNARRGIYNELKRQNPGASASQRRSMRAQADQLAREEVSGRNLDALHNPDMVAGGADRVDAFGESGVNRSLGSGWGNQKSQLEALDQQLRDDLATGRIKPGDRMNVRLSPEL
ncbi:hypothetical protein CGZ95_11460 [Enemella evansiae]|nr:hypothetical protein CGZ95_11460 [Enemella evansiae]